MPIQQIILGSRPKGEGGDNWREGSEKINANFNDLDERVEHAQSTADEKTKNESDSYLLNRQNHTGTQAISTVEGLTNALNGKQGSLTAGDNITIEDGVISATSVQFYDGVDSTSTTTAATANSVKTAYDKAEQAQSTANQKTTNATDSYLLNRENHTGMQAISSISGLSEALDGKQSQLSAGTNINIENGVISAEFADATVEVKGVTRFATLAEAKTGTDATTAITPASLLSVLNAMAFTANMLPHDVTPQRAVNTTYFNTSTSLRILFVGFRLPVGANVNITVDGYIQGFVTNLSGANEEFLTLWGFVPQNKSYRFIVVGGAPRVQACTEYFL